jgi:hypothetical protein
MQLNVIFLAIICTKVLTHHSERRFFHHLKNHVIRNLVKIKIKESRNRPGVAQSVPGGLGSQISMTLGT